MTTSLICISTNNNLKDFLNENILLKKWEITHFFSDIQSAIDSDYFNEISGIIIDLDSISKHDIHNIDNLTKPLLIISFKKNPSLTKTDCIFSTISLDKIDKKQFQKHLNLFEKKIIQHEKTSNTLSQYKNLYNHAPIGIFQITSEGQFLFLNKEMFRILGMDYKKESPQSLNKKYKNFLTRDKRSKQFLQIINKDKFVENFEIPLTNNKDKTIIISITARISSILDGKIFIIDAFVRDITERKKSIEKMTMNAAHVNLINELTTQQHTGITSEEATKKICDHLKEIHNLHFTDLYILKEDDGQNKYIKCIYTNLNNKLLKTSEKLTKINITKIEIPLFEKSLFSTLYNGMVPIECTTTEEIIRAIRDLAPPSNKILRAFAPQVAKIVGNKYLFLVPIIVHNKAYGHIGFNAQRPFAYDEKESIKMICSKISTLFESKINEKELKESLLEKENLLKEIHHRVKNNIQIISSLLALQSEHLETKKDKELFKSNQNRIMSIALVHEQLYKSKSFSQINFSWYIKNLMSEIFQNYSIDTNAIKVIYETKPIDLIMDQALPCALIINEIVSNSISHGFQDKKDCTISITLDEDQKKMITLKISDNGIGLSPDVVSDNTSSLGIQLALNLIKQLGGTLKYTRKKGSHFVIVFKKA